MFKRLPFKSSIGATVIVLIILYSITTLLATILTEGILLLALLLRVM
jgi:hypothetical protein